MSTPRAVLKWLIAGVAVTAVATSFRVTESVMSSMAGHGHDWWRVFVWQLAGWGFWTLFAPILLRRGEALAEARPWWRALPAAVMTGVALFAIHVVFVAGVVQLVQHFQPVALYPFGEALSRQIDSWGMVDLIVITGLTGFGMALTSYRQARQLELNESRLEADLARAELETLRLQLQPHFLFNTLNSIAALIRRGDGEQALDTVVELGEMLRETLGRSRRDSVSLRDEIDFVARYVELQRTRFAEDLQVDFDVPEACLGLGVPTLALQPLVENSIRHGLGRRGRTLRVEVRAELDGGELRLEVSDDGSGPPDGFDIRRDAGVGLGNLRSRLRLMYGEAAVLRLERRAGGGTIARIALPAVAIAETRLGAGRSRPATEPDAAEAAEREGRA